MTPELSLHHLVATDISQVELIRIAAALDCRYVCLFVNDPGGSFPFPYVTDDQLPEIRSALDGEGVQVLAATSFPVTIHTDLDAYRIGLERAAALGASIAGMRVLDKDERRAAETFAAVCDLGAEFGVTIAVEPTQFSATETLASVQRLLSEAARPDARIILDPLHLTRTGMTSDDLRALPSELIGYVQICDGPEKMSDADHLLEWVEDRLPPGEGSFDLATLLEVRPAGLPLSIEVPMNRLRNSGVSAADRAAIVVTATRQLIGG